jgi:predicted acylesterase/phospholipase RssA
MFQPMTRAIGIAAYARATFALALCCCLAACSVSRLPAVPQAQEEQPVIVDGMSGIRYWADESTPEMLTVATDSISHESAARAAAGTRGPLPPANYLAISGGGENGAFGAGLLVGWTASCTRPSFKLVTGISTGALIAPFAFLGSSYDQKLQQAYTTMSSKDVLVQRWYTAALWNDALADNAPLRQTVTRLVDQDMLNAIGAEYLKGRLLFIGTTDLDARRPVMWDIGKIATSGNPKALELVRDLLVASAALPGAFPPMMIDVQVGGKDYQEMHVDGGATAQVFVYPPSFNLASFARSANIVRDRHLYVIRNARLDPEWADVSRQTLSISGRAVSSLIQTQGLGDLYRIYLAAQRDKLDFNLAYIPESFNVPLPAPFDTHYMDELFKLGYTMALKGYPWAKTPPGFEQPETLPVRRGAAR